MKIVQLETKNGRLFRVAISNKSQENRLIKIIAENKGKYEEFINIDFNKCNGINDINEFKKLSESLQ